MSNTCFVIAYWGDNEDVAYVSVTDKYPNYEGDFTSITSAFQRFVCDGHITEVLEVMYGDSYEHAYSRCDYWREELREQGYAISRSKEV